MRRRGEDDVIDLRNRQQLLVAIEAGETILGGNIDARLAEILAAIREAIREHIRQRHDAHVLARKLRAFLDVLGVIARLGINHSSLHAEHIHHRAAAAPATANHPDADGIIRRGVAGEHEGKTADGGHACGGERGVLQEGTAGD